MATEEHTAQEILEKLTVAGNVRMRKMFGEYGVYLDDVFFASICDNQLFIKPTEAGHALLGKDFPMAPPYPGAKDQFVIDLLKMNDNDLAELCIRTKEALPAPKKRRRPER